MTNFPPAPPLSWVYRARSVSNHDGDTVAIECDLGFRIAFTLNLRLLEVNCPELNATDPAVRVQAQAAKQFTTDWLTHASQFPGAIWPLLLASSKPNIPLSTDKFGGRWDGILYDLWGGCLNQALLDAGLAVPMP